MAFVLDNQFPPENTLVKDTDAPQVQAHGHVSPIKTPLPVERFTQVDLEEMNELEAVVELTWTWPLVWDNVREKIDDVIVFCTDDVDATDITFTLGVTSVDPAPTLADADHLFAPAGQVDGAGATNSARILALDAGEILAFSNKTLAPNDTASGIGGTVAQVVEGPAMLTFTATPGQQPSVRGGKIFIGIRKHLYGNASSTRVSTGPGDSGAQPNKYPSVWNEDGTTLPNF